MDKFDYVVWGFVFLLCTGLASACAWALLQIVMQIDITN